MAETPLIDAENLFRQPGPPQLASEAEERWCYGKRLIKRLITFRRDRREAVFLFVLTMLQCMCLKMWPQTDLARSPLGGRYWGVSGLNSDIGKVSD